MGKGGVTVSAATFIEFDWAGVGVSDAARAERPDGGIRHLIFCFITFAVAAAVSLLNLNDQVADSAT